MFDKKTLEKIVTILNDEKSVLEEIASLEEEKIEAVTLDYYEVLDSLNFAEQSLIEQMNSLEKERLFTANKMAQGGQIDSLKNMIELVDENDKSELIQIQHSINAVIQKVQMLKSAFQEILEDKKALADLTISVATGDTGEQGYGSDGRAEKLNKGDRSIILNRSV